MDRGKGNTTQNLCGIKRKFDTLLTQASYDVSIQQ